MYTTREELTTTTATCGKVQKPKPKRSGLGSGLGGDHQVITTTLPPSSLMGLGPDLSLNH